MGGEALDLRSAAAARAPHYLCIREASSLAVCLRIRISPWRFSLPCALHLGVRAEFDPGLIRTGAASDSDLVLRLHSSAPLGRLEGAVHSFQLIRCALVWGPIHRPTLLCGTQSSPNAQIAAVAGYFQHCSVRTKNPGRDCTEGFGEQPECTWNYSCLRWGWRDFCSGSEQNRTKGYKGFGLLETPPTL